MFSRIILVLALICWASALKTTLQTTTKQVQGGSGRVSTVQFANNLMDNRREVPQFDRSVVYPALDPETGVTNIGIAGPNNDLTVDMDPLCDILTAHFTRVPPPPFPWQLWNTLPDNVRQASLAESGSAAPNSGGPIPVLGRVTPSKYCIS